MKKRSTNEHLALRNSLKSWRLFRGYTQSQLAELVGVSKNTISAIETCIFSPSAYLALKLCKVLYVGFDELFWLPDFRPGDVFAAGE